MAHSKYGIEVQRFYNSSEWKKARKRCVIRCNGRCQRCGKPGNEVHHIIPLTDKNVSNRSISLAQENLILLCTSCHNKEREEPEDAFKDYMMRIDKNGEVVMILKKTTEDSEEEKHTPPCYK